MFSNLLGIWYVIRTFSGVWSIITRADSHLDLWGVSFSFASWFFSSLKVLEESLLAKYLLLFPLPAENYHEKNELRCVTNPNNSAQVVKFASVFFWAFSIMLTQVLADDCSSKRLLFTENSKIKSILLNWLVSPKIYSLFSKLIGSTSPFLFQYNPFSFSVSTVRSSLCL